jgi:hypothetical protein
VDAIDGDKQHNALLVIFHEQLRLDTDGGNLLLRTELIQWLDAYKIAWGICGEHADPDMMCSYLGQIDIAVPFDGGNPDYQQLPEF